MAKESRLQDEVGILVIPKNVRSVSNSEYVRFVQSLGAHLAREVYDEAEKLIAKDYAAHPWFQNNVCHRSAGNDGLHGSSPDLNVIYESILRKSGLSLPSFSEGKNLEAQGRLSNGVYREYGLQVASKGKPNTDISRHLIAKAKERNWKFPIVVPSYRPLGHRKGESGFEIYFLDEAEGIDLGKEVIHGEQGRQFLLDNFKEEWIGKKGVHRLDRARYGCWWSAGGDDRGSDGSGRVGFVSGEASAKNLTAVKNKELAREYEAQIAQLTAQKAKELDAFSEALGSYNK